MTSLISTIHILHDVHLNDLIKIWFTLINVHFDVTNTHPPLTMAKTSLKHPASATARAPTRSSKRNAALHGPNDSPGYDTDGSATHASAVTRKSDATRTSAARRSTLKRGNENTSRVGRAKKAAMPSLVRVGADVADSTVVGDDVARRRTRMQRHYQHD